MAMNSLRSTMFSSQGPLVVDLDGTLTPSDTLVESIVSILKRNPLELFRLAYWLISQRCIADFKHRIATRGCFAVPRVPFREDFIAWLQGEKQRGRVIVLATAAHESIARAVAAKIGLFDAVLFSTPTINLKGSSKLAAIQARFGNDFTYAGDSSADLPIFKAASASVLVGANRRVSAEVECYGNIERRFSYPEASLSTWLRAMRVHQWVKNVLMFVPLLTAFAFAPHFILNTAIGFIAFSLAASGTYILNDLWDLNSDRGHPRKCLRPFAAGLIPVERGIAMSALLMGIAGVLAFAISAAFLGMVAIYIVLTTAYSLVLKRYVLIDVVVLALLYTFRVLAGAVAIGVTVTPWLLAFSVFIFFSLALVKRCAELVSLQDSDRTAISGRDYRVTDLTVLWPLGIGAGLCSVLVFGLYVGSPTAIALFGETTKGLWLAGIGLIYWIARIWLKTARGEMDDDPIVFTLKDFGSQVAIAAMVVVTLSAHLIS
jgi:4-hydroxybenzoate polyprenyltransferase/phosphoserine phosphatase